MEFGFDLEKEVGVADTGNLNDDLSELHQAFGVAAKANTAVVLFIDEMHYVAEK